jgi:hypothetical protein
VGNLGSSASGLLGIFRTILNSSGKVVATGFTRFATFL